MSQDESARAALNATPVLWLTHQVCFAAGYVEFGVRLRPRMIEGGVIGHEVEQ